MNKYIVEIDSQDNQAILAMKTLINYCKSRKECCGFSADDPHVFCGHTDCIFARWPEEAETLEECGKQAYCGLTDNILQGVQDWETL